VAEWWALTGRPEVRGQSDGTGGGRGGLDDEEQGPAVQESDQRMEGLAEKRVLSAHPGQHGAQLGEDECAGQRDGTATDPGRQNQEWGLYPLGDDVWIDEDAGADDAAEDDHRRVEEAEPGGESGRLLPRVARHPGLFSAARLRRRQMRVRPRSA